MYALPAIIGLIVKLLFLYFAKSSKKSKAFILFIALVSIHNISELFLFYEISNQTDPTIALKAYYTCLLGALAGMCIYATEVTSPRFTKPASIIISLLLLVVACFVVFTSDIINGFTSLGVLVTAAKGDFYILFQATSITAVCYTLTLLIKSCLLAKTTELKIRSAYVLFSLTPVIIIGVTVLTLISLGVQVSAIALLPIGSTLLVLITLKAENNYYMTDIRMYLPFSKERKISQDLIQIMSEYSVTETDYKKTVKKIERVMLKYSYEKSNFCKSTTAKKLNVSRSTLYGMLERLNIDK